MIVYRYPQVPTDATADGSAGAGGAGMDENKKSFYYPEIL